MLKEDKTLFFYFFYNVDIIHPRDSFHRIRNSIRNGSRRGFIKTSIIPTFRIPLKSTQRFNIAILFQPIYNWHGVRYISRCNVYTSRKFAIELSNYSFFDLKKDDFPRFHVAFLRFDNKGRASFA